MEDDDVTIYIQGWEPEGKPRAVVCFAHGLGDHSGRFEHVGKALNEAGYAFFGFDLRGHGKTGGPRGHLSSLDDVMQDIHQFVDFQKQNFPDTPIFLYGHSLGGVFMLMYSIQHGEGLKGLVVTGLALRSPLLEQKAKVTLVNILGSLLPRLTIPTGLDPATISRDPAVVQRYVSDPLAHDKSSLAFAKSSFIAIDYCFTHARELSIPLLLMHGTADQLTYPSGSEEFAKLAGETNKDVTLKLWEGLYHEVHNEPEQDEVFKFMIEWLNKHL
jgi:alpha-beta hydrolase superfamily lysophospholipase